MANPNPSPSTRFGAENGPKNPGGKTKEQVRAEREAAKKAAILRDKMLSAIMENVDEGENVLDYLSGDTLKLFKDSEDRAHGQADQNVNTRHEGDGVAKLGAFLDAISSRDASKSTEE